MLTRFWVGGKGAGDELFIEAGERKVVGGRQLAEELVERARNEGVDLVGPDGLLSGLTKNVLEAGLEAEMSEHLGYDRHDPASKNTGNSRNATRSKKVKKVLTDVGPNAS